MSRVKVHTQDGTQVIPGIDNDTLESYLRQRVEQYMGLDKLIDWLGTTTRALKAEWKVTPGGQVRCRFDGIQYCPLTFVCMALEGPAYLEYEYHLAGRDLGVSPDLQYAVVNASDNTGGYNTQLRDKVLEACGIKE